MGHFFRLQSADDDPERLLDPNRQRTEPWEGTVYGRCDKCGGSGRTEFRCDSCREGVSDPECPVCGGKVRYLGECPACGGSGEIDDSSREGVSVFPQENGLYRYMLRRRGTLDGALLVELEGEPTADEDFDADEGALLIRPTRIVDVREPDWQSIDEKGTLVNNESEQRQPEQPSGPPQGTGPVDPTKDPGWQDDKRDDDAPETAEPPEAEKLSEKVPEEASGEGDTPLGSTDQHSDAPGPHGTG